MARHAHEQLASGHVDFSYGGLPGVWIKGARTSLYQCSASCGQQCVAVCLVSGVDRVAMAQRDCRRLVCFASAARGVGGLDFGTEGCVERVLSVSDLAGVCGVCEGKIRNSKFETP